MKRAVTVLFCSVGPRAELIECFRAAARDLKLRLRILATDAAPEMSAGCRVADRRFRVARTAKGGIISPLVKICRREKVSLLIPVVADDVAALSEAVGRFRSIGTDVIVSSPSVVRLERDKLASARTLAAAGIRVPETTSLAEFLADPDRLAWPVIAKPISGTASLGILRPRYAGTLREIADENYVVQELWQGREYTVNMYFDRRGRLRCVVPHERLLVRTGEVWHGRTERVAMLRKIALRIAKSLPGARGPIGFQAIINVGGDVAVIEINARIGGGYPLSHHAGANFAGWLLEEAAGLPSTANDRWRAGVTMLRYDGAVFFEDAEMA